MDTDCLSCQEIILFEESLDKRASDLVERVNSLCRDVRSRNKKRWENFAYWVNLPVVGNIVYRLFRAPAGLEPDPDYHNSDWYRPEGLAIEEQARLLETMKTSHMEHWGDELVQAGFPWDYAGYYEHCHPKNPMPRNEAYKTYIVENKEEKLRIFVPDKYDFTSAAGVDKIKEDVFVLDSNSKSVVPWNQCDWSWTALKDTASNIIDRVFAKFARTGNVYILRK